MSGRSSSTHSNLLQLAQHAVLVHLQLVRHVVNLAGNGVVLQAKRR